MKNVKKLQMNTIVFNTLKKNDLLEGVEFENVEGGEETNIHKNDNYIYLTKLSKDSAFGEYEGAEDFCINIIADINNTWTKEVIKAITEKFKEYGNVIVKHRYLKVMPTHVHTHNVCIICGKAFEGYGNNPHPLTDRKGVCCDKCNEEIVVPTRLMNAMKRGK